ncbi:sensor histidine kinase [Sabulicella glaciei]|uniref:histidine kinase n=1 Tax=Sabulicella glaciei TaxID=2984948 RepID=A0ABT3NWX6_9PROT|nr:DUF4118 domain-containing protein [Roseococcus sp. MDT2-1-1]MCW8086638.1 DUF4118 domain-containing protein [Roseococcus sp. MDT2-1-1]
MLRRLLRPALTQSVSTALRWLAAGGLVLVFFGIRVSLFPEQQGLPFLFFFPAIILSAVVFDRGSGIFATLLSAVLAVYFFFPPHGSFAVLDRSALVSIALFTVTGLFVALVTEALHLAYQNVEKLREQAEEARRHAEEVAHERDLLLAELEHRVKNDLARISATISLQAMESSPETVAALDAVNERVRVLARVHDRLGRPDGTHPMEIDVCDYLRDLVTDLRTNLTNLTPIALALAGESHLLSISRAGAVGLVLNELVTNAVKHAFPGDRSGTVTLRFSREGDEYLLAVSDDGVGMAQSPPEEVPEEFRRRAGMGRRLMRALAAQLDGNIVTGPTGPGGGVTQTLRFPVQARAG